MFWEVIALIVLFVVIVGPFAFEQPRDINRRRTKLRYGGSRTTEDDRLWR